jgi:Legionella pneumophila major outer membrane protein precursor
MLRLLRKCLLVGIGASCLWAQGVSAQNECCGRFGVFAEAIYVKPTTGGMEWAAVDCTHPLVESETGIGKGLMIMDEMAFSGGSGDVITGHLTGTVKRRSICPSYNWGFRVGGEYTSCSGCSYAQLAGTYVHFQDGSKASGALVPILPFVYESLIVGPLAVIRGDADIPLHPVYAGQSTWCVIGEGRASLKTDYWDIDARFGRYIHQGCKCNVQAFGGVRYVNICETMTARFGGGTKVDVRLIPEVPIVQILDRTLSQVRKREFTGAGPEIGFGAKFDVWCNLYARGELSGLAIIGTRKAFVKSHAAELTATPDEEAELQQQEPTPRQEFTQCFRFDSCVSVAPGLETRLAVGYGRKCGCLDGQLEIGYTLTHYWNILGGGEALSSPNMAATNSLFERDFGIAGPYIGLRLNY